MRTSTLDACRVLYKVKHSWWPNIDFHKEGTPGPEIIADLDRLLLDAYGLPHDR